MNDTWIIVDDESAIGHFETPELAQIYLNKWEWTGTPRILNVSKGYGMP